MDPTTAILGPWAQLGIVGSVVIALAVVVIYLWRAWHASKDAHLAEVKSCADRMLDLTIRKIESDNKLADALEGVEKVVEAALAALRK
jgi:molybdenum cofactor biosynthesis enzyme MoaA